MSNNHSNEIYSNASSESPSEGSNVTIPPSDRSRNLPLGISVLAEAFILSRSQDSILDTDSSEPETQEANAELHMSSQDDELHMPLTDQEIDTSRRDNGVDMALRDQERPVFFHDDITRFLHELRFVDAEGYYSRWQMVFQRESTGEERNYQEQMAEDDLALTEEDERRCQNIVEPSCIFKTHPTE